MFSIEEKWFTPLELFNNFDFIIKGKIKYLNVAASFDIETTSFYDNGEKRAIMYAWVLGLNGKCCRGRTWGEFLELINIIIKRYKLTKNKRLIIYVHNLSFEFQWIRKMFKWHKVFSIDNRKPIYAITIGGIEFRCSYLLANLSLEKVGENLVKYKVKKKVGDLNYRTIRHSDTPLTESEWGYILNDGLIVMAYIQELIDKYTLANIPLTNTGFVRNFCREECLRGSNRYKYNNLMKELTLTSEEYVLAKRVFSGGFTHANPNKVGKILNNVSSFDFTSSYPTVMISELYPMSKGIKYKPTSKEDFIKTINKYCCLIDVGFDNIVSKINYEHFISKHKCYFIENYILDNGRVVEATKLRIALNDVDFRILSATYSWDKIYIFDMYIYKKDYLPTELLNCVLRFYEDKTKLKGVAGKEEEYLESKGRINAMYGMCVTDICRDNIIYDNEWAIEKVDLEEMIEKYNSSGSRFLSYLWGLFITSYAKYNLWKGILEFKEDYIYSDTDSIKVLNKNNHEEFIKKYNKNIIKKMELCCDKRNLNKKMLAPKTIKGITKYLGLWEYEGTYNKFKTLGAKRYMIEEDDKINITIAGVSKKLGKQYLYDKYKNNNAIFGAFNEDLTFPAIYEVVIDNKIITKEGSGKLTHGYIDFETQGIIVDYLGNKSSYHELSSIHLEPADYHLSLEKMFLEYLLSINNSFMLKK